MKLFQFLKRAKRPLGNSGIAHLMVLVVVVVLCGVAGTYALVSKSSAATNSKNGYLVIFSKSGEYTKAQVSLMGVYPTDHKCGGTLKAKNKYGETNNAIINLKKANPKNPKTYGTSVTCTPVSGDAYYLVKFGSLGPDNKTLNMATTGTVADVDAGYCTFVHSDGRTRKVANGPKGCNGDYNAEDPPKKVDVVVTSLPELHKDGKTLVGYIGVTAPGKSLSREQCSGAVKIDTYEINKSTGQKKTLTYDKPLKYVKDKRYNDGKGYCVANIRSAVPKTRKADLEVGVTGTLAQGSLAANK